MKLIVLSLTLLLSSYAASSAVPPKEVFQFLKPVLEREVNSAGDIWDASGKGGYVLRFDIDVTADGLPEMFLTSTLDMRKQSSTWTVFKAQQNGDYQLFPQVAPGSGVQVYATELWIETMPAGVAIVSWGNDRWGPNPNKWFAGRYIFSRAGISFERTETTKEAMDALVNAGRVVKVVPKVSGLLLVDLLRNPNAQWKPIDFDRNAPDPNGYFIAAEDAERVKGLGNFTPDLALRWLASAAAGKTPIDASAVPIPEPAPEPSPTPSVPPAASPSPTAPVAQTPAPVVERGAPVWLWVVGIAALIVIALLVWKRRA